MKESGTPTLAHSLECSKCKAFKITQSQGPSKGTILKEFLGICILAVNCLGGRVINASELELNRLNSMKLYLND